MRITSLKQANVRAVEQIAFEAKKLDEQCKSTESTHTLLKERRSVVIAAAVTWQIDLGSAA